MNLALCAWPNLEILQKNEPPYPRFDAACPLRAAHPSLLLTSSGHSCPRPFFRVFDVDHHLPASALEKEFKQSSGTTYANWTRKNPRRAETKLTSIGNETDESLWSIIMKKTVALSLVVVALVVVSIGYYEYTAYAQTPVQTTVVTGKITGIQKLRDTERS